MVRIAEYADRGSEGYYLHIDATIVCAWGDNDCESVGTDNDNEDELNAIGHAVRANVQLEDWVAWGDKWQDGEYDNDGRGGAQGSCK